MGHSIRDLEMYMQVVLAAEPVLREPKCVSPSLRLYTFRLTPHAVSSRTAGHLQKPHHQPNVSA
jgi:hypothetical protein